MGVAIVRHFALSFWVTDWQIDLVDRWLCDVPFLVVFSRRSDWTPHRPCKVFRALCTDHSAQCSIDTRVTSVHVSWKKFSRQTSEICLAKILIPGKDGSIHITRRVTWLISKLVMRVTAVFTGTYTVEDPLCTWLQNHVESTCNQSEIDHDLGFCLISVRLLTNGSGPQKVKPFAFLSWTTEWIVTSSVYVSSTWYPVIRQPCVFPH